MCVFVFNRGNVGLDVRSKLARLPASVNMFLDSSVAYIRVKNSVGFFAFGAIFPPSITRWSPAQPKPGVRQRSRPGGTEFLAQFGFLSAARSCFMQSVVYYRLTRPCSWIRDTKSARNTSSKCDQSRELRCLPLSHSLPFPSLFIETNAFFFLYLHVPERVSKVSNQYETEREKMRQAVCVSSAEEVGSSAMRPLLRKQLRRLVCAFRPDSRSVVTGRRVVCQEGGGGGEGIKQQRK